jgi:hypothetical protein
MTESEAKYIAELEAANLEMTEKIQCLKMASSDRQTIVELECELVRLNKEKDLLRRQCVDPKYCVGHCKRCGDLYYPETVYLQCPLCFGKEIDRLKEQVRQLQENGRAVLEEFVGKIRKAGE